jgi:hypothetical protein
MALVMDAVSLLPPASRTGFLESVVAVLGDHQRPPDAAVSRALKFILAERGVSVSWQTLKVGTPIDQAMRWRETPLAG